MSHLRIEDYALLGDTRTAALVGNDGSIDWLCLPRFDSGACFASLLGDSENGRWKLAPRGAERATHRCYRDGSLVLETAFDFPGGAVTVIDFMPLGQSAERVDLVRLVRCDRGAVEMETEIVFRFDYGKSIPWVRARPWGIRAVAGPDAIELRTPVELVGQDFTTVSHFRVTAGQIVPFVLTWSPSHRPAPEPFDPLDALNACESDWRAWGSQCTYRGPRADLVSRSLVVLKALTYSPTGGMVAAPTTSLPEDPGGVRNWDYRYCWLRDATLTLYALLASGYDREAADWDQWLLRAVAGSPWDLQIMYGVAGERMLPELALDWLPGYEGSSPVRVGNAAHRQLQLDVYGEIMDCFHLAGERGVEPGGDLQRLQRAIVDFLASSWTCPDRGIWEMRGRPRQLTYSKVMAWVAVDRAVKAVERFGLDGPLDEWRRLRAEIHDAVCREGYNPKLGCFVQSFGSEDLDASLLMIPLVGFLPPRDPRVLGTIEAVRSRLMPGGLVLRYSNPGDADGLPGHDAPFLACTFWLADALHMAGDRTAAIDTFNRLAALANDVGLLAEEYDPVAGRMLGNFPQAFSHVALVNTAHNLFAPGRRPAEHRSSRSPAGQ